MACGGCQQKKKQAAQRQAKAMSGAKKLSTKKSAVSKNINIGRIIK